MRTYLLYIALILGIWVACVDQTDENIGPQEPPLLQGDEWNLSLINWMVNQNLKKIKLTVGPGLSYYVWDRLDNFYIYANLNAHAASYNWANNTYAPEINCNYVKWDGFDCGYTGVKYSGLLTQRDQDTINYFIRQYLDNLEK